MSNYSIYLNKQTDLYFREQARPDETMSSCIARFCREEAAKHSKVIDAESCSGITLDRLIREGK